MFCKSSEWIGCPKSMSSPIVIKKFTVKNPQRARIDICGLGYYELFVNGKRVGCEYFKPVVSDYSERDFSDYLYPLYDQTSHTVYYNTYNITAYLHDGENTLAVMLGNGFYRQTVRVIEGNTKFSDELLLRFDLRLTEDGNPRRIYTDGTERLAEGFIKENNLFFGEFHDYADFDFSLLLGHLYETLRGVHTVLGPKAKIRKQRCKNDTVRERIVPRVVHKTSESVIYDVGKNISGFVSLKAVSPLVRVRHAEQLKDGALDFHSAGGDGQISEMVYKNAEGRVVHPWFCWSGFRYFEVFGEVEEVEALFVCSDVAITSSFACGNETINWLFHTYVHTQLCNMHGAVPSDCPHRERLGYTGDGQLTAECAMLLTDSRRFYEKWIRDIADCQDIKSGHVQHTAPFFGGGGGPGGWGCAMVVVPYAYYKMYGDVSILKRYYTNMCRYLESMRGFCENGLVVKEREGGWCLGDWCTPTEVRLPEPFVNTFYYIRCMRLVQEIAQLIGEKADYTAQISDAMSAIDRTFFDPSTGNYCDGVQGANAFALTLGLGDARTKENLLSHYRQTKVLDTGILGTDVLTAYLAEFGELQLLFDLLSAESYPSFGFMRAGGATTLWEHWNGHSSHSHPMFGACVKQLFYAFVGIKADAGFAHVTLSPKYIEGMGFLRAKLKLPGGTLSIQYRYANGKLVPQVKATGSIQVKWIEE